MLRKISSSSQPLRLYSPLLAFALLQLRRFSSLYMQKGNSRHCRQKMSNYCCCKASSLAGLKLLILKHIELLDNIMIEPTKQIRIHGGFKEASSSGTEKQRNNANIIHQIIIDWLQNSSKSHRNQTKQVCCLLSLCLLFKS